LQELQNGEGPLSVLWAIIQAKNLGRAKLRLSRRRRVLPGSDGASPYRKSKLRSQERPTGKRP
jgi:hypothetical protein